MSKDGGTAGGRVDLQGTVVLIVDDQSEVLQVASRLVTIMGATTLTAGSGAEALKVLDERGGDVDVALLDITMPGVSGIDVADRMVQEFPKIAVILTSGYTEFDHDVSGRAFLRKPYTRKTLGAALRSALGIDAPS